MHNTHDNCIYERGAHCCWNKVDSNDLIDYPSARIQLARDRVGDKSILTAGGHRNSKDSSMTTSFDDNSIPPQLRQSSYKNAHSCVWLSACLLMNSVNTTVVKLTIERYQKNENMYE